MKYYGFVYLWFDIKNKRYIIGSHHGSLNDNYTTTTGGVYVKNIFKKRPDTMKRRVLEYNTTIDDYRYTQQLEQKWLDKRPNICDNNRYYNMKNWATGGVDISIPRTKPEEWRQWKSDHNKQRVQEGTHNFTSDNCSIWAKERVNKGTHHFLHSDFNKKSFKLYRNDELIGVFESKEHAKREGIPAHLIDKLRKNGEYTIQRGGYTNRRDIMNKGDKFVYTCCT